MGLFLLKASRLATISTQAARAKHARLWQNLVVKNNRLPRIWICWLMRHARLYIVAIAKIATKHELLPRQDRRHPTQQGRLAVATFGLSGLHARGHARRAGVRLERRAASQWTRDELHDRATGKSGLGHEP